MKVMALLLAFTLFQTSPATPQHDAAASFLARARQATEKYKDQAAAIINGYRRIGRDFPAMGEHWIKIGFLFDGKFDAAEPEILTYVTVSGKPQLLGVAYAVPLLPGEPTPDGPTGKAAWHDHFGTLDDETFLPQHHAAKHGAHSPRIAMLHAWIWSENPEGVFAADNWNVSFIRAGMPIPGHAQIASAKAVSLAVGGKEHVLMSIEAAVNLNAGQRAAIENALSRSGTQVEKLLRGHSPGNNLTAAELEELSNMWARFWVEVDRSVAPEMKERMLRLPIR